MDTIRAIIFDLDGVICFTDNYHYQAWKELADAEGIYFDEKINAYIYECKISANGIEESRKMIFFSEENFEKN